MNKWQEIQGIYIHIPFCLQKCAYCDFASFPRQNEEIMKQYTQRLCQEITTWRGALPVVSTATVYFGGGTPSLLTVQQIEEIINAVRESFNVDKQAEITIEANPAALNYEKLTALYEAGINRQSFPCGISPQSSIDRFRHKAILLC